MVRNIEILGEASKSTKEKYSEIEWGKIAKTRDEIIWDILKRNHLK
ncbi:hypothetical protein M1N11_02390 [Peptococcaceae bacterium]|nr:hypothetical protein [Peptococcaceae bacterium]